VYVAEDLPKGTKEKLLEIRECDQSSVCRTDKEIRLDERATKEKALKKLNAIIMKVGYPDKWKDLSGMHIDRSSYVRNVMSANKWELNTWPQSTVNR